MMNTIIKEKRMVKRSISSSLFIVLSLIAWVGFSACEDKVTTPIVSISGLTPNTIVLPSSYAQDTTIAFKATETWRIQAEKTFVTFTPDGGGAGEQQVKITVKANPSQKADSTQITIFCGKDNFSFFLKRAPQPTNLLTDFELASTQDEHVISFEANQQWSAKTTEEWIVLEKVVVKQATSLNGDAGIQMLKIKALDYNKVPSRVGKVTITIGNTKKDIVVTQKGVAPFITTSLGENPHILLSLSSTNEYFVDDIKVTGSNVDWELRPQSENNEWFTTAYSTEDTKVIKVGFSFSNNFHWPVYPLTDTIVLKDRLSDFALKIPVDFPGWKWIPDFKQVWEYAFTSDQRYLSGDKFIVNIETDGINKFKSYALSIKNSQLEKNKSNTAYVTASWLSAKLAEDQSTAPKGTQNWEIYVNDNNLPGNPSVKPGSSRKAALYFIPENMEATEFKKIDKEYTELYFACRVTQLRGAKSKLILLGTDGNPLPDYYELPAEGGEFSFPFTNTGQQTDLVGLITFGKVSGTGGGAEININTVDKKVIFNVLPNTSDKDNIIVISVCDGNGSGIFPESGIITFKQKGGATPVPASLRRR